MKKFFVVLLLSLSTFLSAKATDPGMDFFQENSGTILEWWKSNIEPDITLIQILSYEELEDGRFRVYVSGGEKTGGVIVEVDGGVCGVCADPAYPVA